MGETTAISWADATVNFWMGCTALSPACDSCYARNLVQDRFGRAVWGGPGLGAGTRTRTGEASWKLPFYLHRAAERASTRPFVFVNSLADTFDNAVPAEWRRDAFDVMRRTPRLVYLLLTKRPGNIAQMATDAGGLPPNVAIGTTVEDQERAINLFRLADAARATRPLFTFASFEPLLERVDPTRIVLGESAAEFFAHPEIKTTRFLFDALRGAPSINLPALGWAITGGETDQGAHKARPTHPDWFRSLRDQCASTGVPYHHKQNGEWAPGECAGRGVTRTEEVATFYSEEWDSPGWDFSRVTRRQSEEMHRDDEPDVWRMGKGRAGRLLDGVLHDARPAVPAMERVHA